MQLSSTPAEYSSAFGDNFFCFEGADPTRPVQISFWADGSTPTLLGTKRFLGSSSFSAGISNFLSRALSPEPTVSSISRIAYPAGRNVVAYASWDDTYRSASIPFVAAAYSLSAPMAIGGAARQSRCIGRSECDEVTFTAPAESSIDVRLTFPDGQTLSTSSSTGSRAGLWSFFINISTLLGMVEDGASQSGVEVVVSVAEQEVVRVSYSFVERGEGAVRLAWLSPSGAICYHTFPVVVSEHWRAANRSVECSAEGLMTLWSEGWNEMELRSGHLAEEDAERLSTLLSSPFVWRCLPSGAYESQHILSGSSTLRGDRGGEVVLTLRSSGATRTW